MKFQFTLIALAAFPLQAAAQDLFAAANKRCEQKTQAMLTALDASDHATASADFSVSLRENLSPEKLRGAWEALPPKFGPLKAIGRYHAGQLAGHPQIYIPLIFERATVTGEVACASDGTITDFKLTPPRE